MKTDARLLTAYRIGLLVVLFGVVLHAPLSVWLSSLWPDYALLIKSWKELALFALATIAVILLTRERQWQRVLQSRIVQLCIGFILLHLLLLPLFWQGLAPSVAGLMIDLRFIAAFLLFYILSILEPTALKSVIKTILIGGAAVIGFGVLQIAILPDDILSNLGYSKATITPYSTIDKNPDFVRINSTTRGPNPLGAMCIIYASLLSVWLARKWRALDSKWRWGTVSALVATIAVLFASFSRSAYTALAVSLLIITGVVVKLSRKQLVAGSIASAAVVVGVVTLLGSSDWYQNVVLHQDPESSVVTKSNDGHVVSLEEGTERLSRQPLGAGIGSTGSATLYGEKHGPTIENYYLFVAHEVGWIGLACFLAIVILTLRELYSQRRSVAALATFASGIGLCVIGLLLPVWTDDTVSITWWALAGSIIGSDYAKRTRQ